MPVFPVDFNCKNPNVSKTDHSDFSYLTDFPALNKTA